MSKEKQIEHFVDFLWYKTNMCDEDLIYDVAEALVNAGYRKQEWISVDDKLPDKKQTILAYRGEFRGDIMDIYIHLGNGLWEDAYGYRASTEHEGITHWMYLPEPPKGE